VCGVLMRLCAVQVCTAMAEQEETLNTVWVEGQLFAGLVTPMTS
jgi:hypothetical protein